jgi:hypothetical protein
MRISSSGKLGLGVSAPQGNLDIDVAVDTSLGLRSQTGLIVAQYTGAPAVGNRCQIGLGYGNTYTNVSLGAVRTSAAAYGTDDFVIAVKPGTADSAPTERLRLTSTGTLGVFNSGATSPRLDIAYTSGTGINTRRWGFGGATGNASVFYVINESNVGVYLAHGNQAWIAHSDERIKENITDVGTVLPSLMNMRCVKYNLISNPDDTRIGFIAQDWESAFPEIVDENEHLVLEDDGTIGTDDDSDSTTPVKAMAYTETIPLLLKAIQEQQATIEALTQRIETLENN